MPHMQVTLVKGRTTEQKRRIATRRFGVGTRLRFRARRLSAAQAWS